MSDFYLKSFPKIWIFKFGQNHSIENNGRNKSMLSHGHSFDLGLLPHC